MYGGRWFFRPIGADGNAGGNEQGNRRELESETETAKETDRPQEETDFHKIIWDNYLVGALAIGVPFDLFWHLTPVKLESFYKADELKRKRRDEEMWFQGLYFKSALECTVCNSFLWRGKNSEPSRYVEKPFLQQSINTNATEDNQLSNDEIKKKTEQLFLQLQIMATNHNLEKKQQQKINEQ